MIDEDDGVNEVSKSSVSSSPSTVEQEQIQKKTFTNWVNAQLAKVSCTSDL